VCRSRYLGELVRILKVVAPQANHVTAGDRVPRRVHVDQAHARPSRLGIEQLAEGNGDELAPLHGDHGGVATREQILGGRVAQVARVLHIEGYGIRTAQLVADVLGYQSHFQAELGQPLVYGRPEHLANVYLGDPDVTVGIALHLVEPFEVIRVNPQHQPLRDDGHAVAASVAQPLHDRAHQRVHHLLHSDGLGRELLGYERERGRGRLAYTEGQMAGFAAHGDHQIPARGRPSVDHEVLDDIHSEMPRRLEPEGVHVRREVEIVVDGFGHVHHPDAPTGLLLQPHGREGGVITPNSDEARDIESQQRDDGVLEQRGVGGGIGARYADEGPAPEMNAAYRIDGERNDVADIAFTYPGKAVLDTNHIHPIELAADGSGADDAIDTRRRTPAHENANLLLRSHIVLIPTTGRR